LYEIAPLDAMVAELAVPDEEISYVREGLPVTVRLDAHPGRALKGRIARVHPRAETRDTDNVFVAEMLLDNPDAGLRPGMKGRAKIRSDRRWLWWILFHEPWERVTCWLRW
jgi:hypothetical protein